MAGSIYILPRDRVHPVDIPLTKAIKAIGVFSKWGTGAGEFVRAMQQPVAVGHPRAHSARQMSRGAIKSFNAGRQQPLRRQQKRMSRRVVLFCRTGRQAPLLPFLFAELPQGHGQCRQPDLAGISDLPRGIFRRQRAEAEAAIERCRDDGAVARFVGHLQAVARLQQLPVAVGISLGCVHPASGLCIKDLQRDAESIIGHCHPVGWFRRIENVDNEPPSVVSRL